MPRNITRARIATTAPNARPARMRAQLSMGPGSPCRSRLRPGPRLVDGHVAEPVRVLVQGAGHMAHAVALESGEELHDALVDRLEVGMLDPVDPADLARDELRIHPQVHVPGTQPAGLLERRLDRGPLRVVVRPHAEEGRQLGP